MVGGTFGCGNDRTWKELRVTDAQLKAVRHAWVDECIIGKCCDAEFITYCNRVQDIALNSQARCHECFRSYYQVKGSKQDGSLCIKRGIFSVGESQCSNHYYT